MSVEVKQHLNNLCVTAAIAAAVALMPACSGNSERENAQKLLDDATEAFENQDYSRAIALTDSIKNAYPGQIEIRRRSLHVAARATEGLTLRRLEQADSLLAVLGVEGDSLSRLIRYVDNPVEGYYAGKNANTSTFTKTTGLQARVSPDGNFYMLSSLAGKKVNSTSVTVSSGGKDATTLTVAFDGERNDRSMGSEVITFIEAECDTVGRFLSGIPGDGVTLTFNGSSSYSMPMKKEAVEEIATMYRYASVTRRAKVTTLERERLSRALEISRSQAARTFVESDNEQ